MIDSYFAHALLERYGSPLYAYDLDEVSRRAYELRAMLPPESRLIYSLKANPLVDIAATLKNAGCALEVSSTSELLIGLEAGFSPEQMHYSGPGKTAQTNHEALCRGVTSFTCDTWGDLERLGQACTVSGVSARALLRINIADEPAYHVGVGARQSHFGVNMRSLLDGGPERFRSCKALDLIGIHVYSGTQIGGVGALCQTFRSTLDLAEQVAQAGLRVDIIDLGGGFAWPFATRKEPPDLSGLSTELERIDDHRTTTAAAELWFESGRYLVASCGTLLATVLDVKEMPSGRKVVVVDTGIMHLGGLSGLGLIHRAEVHLEALQKISSDREIIDVVGPTDNPLDRIAGGAKVAPLEPGDAVAIPNVGAYGSTASMTPFAGRPSAVEVCYRNGEVTSVFRLRTGHERVA